MYEFQDLTPISGHFRTNFKISGQRPRLLKGKGAYSSLWIGNQSQSYGASPAIWDHTVLPACHPTQVNVPRLNPSHAGRYSIYLPWRDGRLS